MEKWEYKIITQEAKFKGWITTNKNMKLDPIIEQILNNFGNEGWELVNTAPWATVMYGETGHFIFVFKRKI